MITGKTLAPCLFLLTTLGMSRAGAQVPDDLLRNALRQSVRSHGFGNQIQGLTGLGAVTGTSRSRLTIDGSGPASDTEISRINRPLARQFESFGPGNTALHLELDLGWLRSETGYRDLLMGTRDEAHAESEINALSAIVGVGLQVPMNAHWSFAPIVLLGYSYVEDETDFQGAAANALDGLTQGLLFNYDSQEVLYGGAMQFKYHRALTHDIDVLWRLRYNHLFAETLDSSHDALDASGNFGVFTTSFEADGPTTYRLFNREVRWIAFAGNTVLTGDANDTFGFDYLFEVGLGVKWMDRSLIKGLEGVSLRSSYVFGKDIEGWGFGGRLEF